HETAPAAQGPTESAPAASSPQPESPARFDSPPTASISPDDELKRDQGSGVPAAYKPPNPTQLTFELPAPPATDDTPLVPVRMVNEWVYCPRLAFLEWVDGEWADSGDTEEGRRVHVRVDAGGGKLPPAGETEEKPDFTARSVTLASEALGIIAR